VVDPPLVGGGIVYTWGSGLEGQLGLGEKKFSATPTFVQDFVSMQVMLKKINCGIYHNATISQTGELYTWGSNRHGELGRSAESDFTPHPGYCSGFGAIVDRIGRGLPASVACGKGYTIIATHPYEGPDEATALRLVRDRREREENRRQREEIEAARRRAQALIDAKNRKLQEKLKFLVERRLCTLDDGCPGFQMHAIKESVCKHCGYSHIYHTILRKEPELPLLSREAEILQKMMGSKRVANISLGDTATKINDEVHTASVSTIIPSARDGK